MNSLERSMPVKRNNLINTVQYPANGKRQNVS